MTNVKPFRAEQKMIPLFDVRLSPDEICAVGEALESGWLTMGPRTSAFEEAFAGYLGTRHGIAVANGTAALHLAYLAAGIGPGDEVIVPAMTFVATAAAVRYCGATPVFADIVGPHDFGIDPDHVASLVTPRTKAVVAMHYAGYCANLEALSSLCDERGLVLLEDAAHSPGASPRGGGGKAGTWGLAGAFSFFTNKVLGCGEGGFVCTNVDTAAAFVRNRRSHGMTSGTWERHSGHSNSYDVLALGYNYRLDEPRAALLLKRLGTIEEDLHARRRLVHRYRRVLADVPGVSIPYTDCDVDVSSCYVMPIVVEYPELRDALREELRQRGVQTSVLYPAIHEFTAYRDGARGSLPRTESVARAQLTLPLFPHLSAADQDHVVSSLHEGMQSVTALRSRARGAVVA